MSKLKRCPFCGGKAALNKGIGLDGLNGWVVECNNYECIAYSLGSIYRSQDAAITRWNTRKPMERIVERLEQQKGFHKKGWNEHNAYDEYGAYFAIDRAIEIVKEESELHDNA